MEMRIFLSFLKIILSVKSMMRKKSINWLLFAIHVT